LIDLIALACVDTANHYNIRMYSDVCTYYPPHLGQGPLSDDARLTSDVSLSVAYIGPKLRTERPRKTKIGKEVAHDTCD